MADNITKWSDDEVISLLSPDIEKAKSIQTELGTQREDYYKMFRMEKYGNEREGFSQSVASTVYSNHKWTMANLMDIFNEEFFLLQSDNEERSAKFQKLIYYQMFRKQDGFRKFYDFIYTANLAHYAVFKVQYKEDFDLVDEKYDALSSEEIIQITQDPNVTVSKYTEVENDDGSVSYEKVKIVRKDMKYAGPHFEVVPNWEFFYSPDCRITDWGGIEGRLVFHKVKRTLNDVRKKEKAGVYKKGTFEKVKEMYDPIEPDTSEKTEVLFNSDSLSVQDVQEPSNREENILSREVEIYECYFNLDIDGDGLLEKVIIDLCGDVVCRIEENPYGRPTFRVGHLYPEPHKVTGLTMPSLLENDQKIATNLLRLIQDSAAIDCYKNPVTSDQQMFTMLQSRKPFAVIKGDPTKLGEVKTSPPSQFILKAYELLKAENEEKTGISRYNQGMDASSLNKTATGIDAIMAASAKPMRLTARVIANGAILGLLRDFIFINQKWPPKETMKILGTQIEVNPEDLSGEHDIEIDIGVGPAEKNAMANQLDLLVQFGTQAGLNLGIMTPAHLARAERKKYKLLGVKVDDLMLDDQQITQQEQQKQQQSQDKPADLREYVQLDKLYPLLTPNEQAQILHQFGIQPDPVRQSLPPNALSGETPADMMRSQPQPQMMQSPASASNQSGGMPIQGRAMGGDINAGQPYVVGERGPELIVPQQDGTVIPNPMMSPEDVQRLMNELGQNQYAGGLDVLGKMFPKSTLNPNLIRAERALMNKPQGRPVQAPAQAPPEMAMSGEEILADMERAKKMGNR